jgi:hypothetical protein
MCGGVTYAVEGLYLMMTASSIGREVCVLEADG